MFRQKMIMDVQGSEDRIYRFECDPGAPLGEVHDALFTMKNIVLKQIEEHQSKEQPKKEECQEQDKS